MELSEVKCPYCKAAPGAQCVIVESDWNRGALTSKHQARTDEEVRVEAKLADVVDLNVYRQLRTRRTG